MREFRIHIIYQEVERKTGGCVPKKGSPVYEFGLVADLERVSTQQYQNHLGAVACMALLRALKSDEGESE